ncbi:VOC family protein [Paenibacillus physcomitrellae]|uniref:VOC family protein n=1 Tax=Paenibacillus physcomitrellae TaxID=1619311 RepID=A0ABQ1FMB9_9BACL|nr:VOC family protein [Paenibacillus physcomitrellae]GGA21199.1 VOC family protein [Paenibacillus physcomitrellae]
MITLRSHLFLENCREALEGYRQIFGGEIRNAQLSDGIEGFKGQEGKYLHAELHIKDHCVLYFADVFRPVVQGNQIWLSIEAENDEELTRIFNGLSEGGEVQMPLEVTFWGAKYGVVKDRNGITWELNLPNTQ